MTTTVTYDHTAANIALTKIDQARALAEMLGSAEGAELRAEAFRTLPGLIADLLEDAQSRLDTSAAL